MYLWPFVGISIDCFLGFYASVFENIQLSLLMHTNQALSLDLVDSRDRLLLVAFINCIVLKYCLKSFAQQDKER